MSLVLESDYESATDTDVSSERFGIPSDGAVGGCISVIAIGVTQVVA